MKALLVGLALLCAGCTTLQGELRRSDTVDAPPEVTAGVVQWVKARGFSCPNGRVLFGGEYDGRTGRTRAFLRCSH